MSYRLICFLLFYLIFGGVAGFTLYMFFTKFGGFGSIPNKLPDKLPDVPSSTPSVPTQSSNIPSFDDIKNNKWVYGGIGVGSVVIFSLMTVCGFFWCLCHSPDNRQNNGRVRRNNVYELQERTQNQGDGDVSFPSDDVREENSLEQLLTKVRAKLSEEGKDWLEMLLEAQEEIIKGRNDDFVQQEFQKAKKVLGEWLESEEINKLLQADLSFVQQNQTQVETLPSASSSSKLL